MTELSATESASPEGARGAPSTLPDCAAIFFAAIVTAGIGFAIGSALGGRGSLAETAGGLIGLWCGMVPGAVIISRARGTGSIVRDFGLRFERRDWIGVPIGFASQFLLLPVIYLLMTLVSGEALLDEIQEPARELTDQARPGVEFAFLAVLLVVGAPIVEELFYRGMLFGALRNRFAVWIAIAVSALVFGLAHFEPLLIAGLAAFGAVLAWLRARTGHLGAAIVAHATFNAITVAALANA